MLVCQAAAQAHQAGSSSQRAVLFNASSTYCVSCRPRRNKRLSYSSRSSKKGSAGNAPPSSGKVAILQRCQAARSALKSRHLRLLLSNSTRMPRLRTPGISSLSSASVAKSSPYRFVCRLKMLRVVCLRKIAYLRTAAPLQQCLISRPARSA